MRQGAAKRFADWRDDLNHLVVSPAVCLSLAAGLSAWLRPRWLAGCISCDIEMLALHARIQTSLHVGRYSTLSPPAAGWLRAGSGRGGRGLGVPVHAPRLPARLPGLAARGAAAVGRWGQAAMQDCVPMSLALAVRDVRRWGAAGASCRETRQLGSAQHASCRMPAIHCERYRSSALWMLLAGHQCANDCDQLNQLPCCLRLPRPAVCGGAAASAARWLHRALLPPVPAQVGPCRLLVLQ